MTPVACDLLLTAEYVLTQDEERAIIENGFVAVHNGNVLAVGPQKRASDYTPVRRLDLGAALILPGLVNAHTHVSMTFLRGFADDLPLLEWLNNHIFPVEKHLTAEIVELGTLLGCAEMTRTGTTALQDMYLIEDAVISGVDKAGLKARLGDGIFAFPTPRCPSVEASFDLARRHAELVKNTKRLRTGIMPHTVYTTTPEILVRCRDLADELNLPLHIHAAESPAETALCLQNFGGRPIALLDRAGLLGPTTTLAHAVDLTDEELDRLAATGTVVAHCPRSNMKLSSGAARFDDMRARSIPVGLGTDGAASNNALNMFGEMNTCALLHKVSGDPTAAPAASVLDAATLGGSKALCWDGLGALTPGAPADLIALDLTAPNLLPMYSPVSHLVYAATGHEVRLTVVDGEVLYEDGRYTRFDGESLFKEAAKLKRWVLDKAGR